MSAPEDSMDDRLTLQALREEMVFTRVLLGEQYATSIDAGAANLSNNQTSAIADAAQAMIAALPEGYRGEE